MAIDLNQDFIVDIRQPILGDSFGWEDTEPPAAKKSLVVHHSASDTNQDGFDIAAYHVNHNGWGGIGYHFVITHDDYKGRPPFTQPGAQIQYVGDLDTWRAHVKDSNPGRVGICLVGNFVDNVPSQNQLHLLRQLVDFFIAPNQILPSINFYSQVTGHGLIPGQQTECPGYANPHFDEWMGYIKGGNFPTSLFAPAPTPPSPTPAPAPTPTPGMGGGSSSVAEQPVPIKEVVPGGVAWESFDTPHVYVVQREGAFAKEALTNTVLEQTKPHLTKGTEVQVAGIFSFSGEAFARTVYARDHKTWTGVPMTFFQQPDVPAPAPTPPVEPNLLDDDNLSQRLQEGILQLPPEQKRTLWSVLGELLAILASPLIKILGVKTNGN